MYNKNQIKIARYKYTHQRLNVGISLFVNKHTFANPKSTGHMGGGKENISFCH